MLILVVLNTHELQSISDSSYHILSRNLFLKSFYLMEFFSESLSLETQEMLGVTGNGVFVKVEPQISLNQPKTFKHSVKGNYKYHIMYTVMTKLLQYHRSTLFLSSRYSCWKSRSVITSMPRHRNEQPWPNL